MSARHFILCRVLFSRPETISRVSTLSCLSFDQNSNDFLYCAPSISLIYDAHQHLLRIACLADSCDLKPRPPCLSSLDSRLRLSPLLSSHVAGSSLLSLLSYLARLLCLLCSLYSRLACPYRLFSYSRSVLYVCVQEVLCGYVACAWLSCRSSCRVLARCIYVCGCVCV